MSSPLCCCRYQLLRPARAYSELFAPLKAQGQATGAAAALVRLSGLDAKAAAQQAVQNLQPVPAKAAAEALAALVEGHLALIAQVPSKLTCMTSLQTVPRGVTAGSLDDCVLQESRHSPDAAAANPGPKGRKRQRSGAGCSTCCWRRCCTEAAVCGIMPKLLLPVLCCQPDRVLLGSRC